MIRSQKILLVALMFPIIALAIIVGYRNYILSAGTEVILPVTGYDPRDLLSGHYLIYTIDYGVSGVCLGNSSKMNTPAYICLDPKMFSYSWTEKCKLVIKGSCNQARFEAGIERYYVPEEKAKNLEALLRSEGASIVLSITDSGKVQIKSLLIGGRHWKD